MKIFGAAVRDWFLGVKATDSPVWNYFDELKNGVHTKTENIRQKIYSLEGKRTSLEAKKESTILNNHRKLVRATSYDVSDANRDVRIAQSRLKNLDDRMSNDVSPLEEARESYKKSNAKYQLWEEVIGRPAYSEKLDKVIDRIRGKQSLTDPQSVEGNLLDQINEENSWLHRYKGMMLTILTPLLIWAPLEVTFIAPAFQQLTESRSVGISIATLFVLVLVLVVGASLLATLFRSCTKRKIISLRNSETKHVRREVKTEANRIMSFAFVFAVLLIISLVVSGASLRSHVPDLLSYDQQAKSAEKMQNRAFLMYQAETYTKAQYDQDTSLAQDNLEGAIKDKAATKKLFVPVYSADFFLSVSLYLLIVMILFVANIFRTDPIFEYYLVSKKRYDDLRKLHVWEYLVSEWKQQLEMQLESAQQTLREKGDVEVIQEDARDQPNVTSIDEQIEEIDSTIWELKSAIESINNNAQENAKHSARRYAKYLRFLMRSPKPLQEYNEIFNTPSNVVNGERRKRNLRRVG